VYKIGNIGELSNDSDPWVKACNKGNQVVALPSTIGYADTSCSNVRPRP
jgi:hypothetical protein